MKSTQFSLLKIQHWAFRYLKGRFLPEHHRNITPNILYINEWKNESSVPQYKPVPERKVFKYLKENWK
jgi:hypothetical protein